MKKVCMVLFTLLISVAFLSTVFAQTKPEIKPAAVPEKPKPKPKPKGIFVGEVYSVNDKTKTLTVTGKEGTAGEKGDVTFDVKNAKFIGYSKTEDIFIGDKVSVKYTTGGAEVKKIAGKVPEKPKKEAAKPKKNFKDIDKNQDGKITIEELIIVFISITPEQFKTFDKNSDGALDEKEFSESVKKMK